MLLYAVGMPANRQLPFTPVKISERVAILENYQDLIQFAEKKK